MRQPDRFEVTRRGRGVYRPHGAVTLAEAVAEVEAAICAARDRGLDEVLVNLLELTGFERPGLAERYFFIKRWAHSGQGRVRMALVVRADVIDPQRFGVTVAANAGMTSDVFDSEPEAAAWLDGLRTRATPAADDPRPGS